MWAIVFINAVTKEHFNPSYVEKQPLDPILLMHNYFYLFYSVFLKNLTGIEKSKNLRKKGLSMAASPDGKFFLHRKVGLQPYA